MAEKNIIKKEATIKAKSLENNIGRIQREMTM